MTRQSLLQQHLKAWEASAEFGAFVGFSAIRFAREGGAQFRGISLEVDPVHTWVARYFIDLALLSNCAEVWLGLLQDTLALLAERIGERSEAFTFMDQRGTTFHEDLDQLCQLRLHSEPSTVAADNVNKPGSPIYLWQLAQSSCISTTLWSLREFATSAIEDWQSVSIMGLRT